MPLGPSSNIAFLGHLSRTVARLSHASQPWRPSPAEDNPHSGGYTGAFFNFSRASSPALQNPATPQDKVNIYALPTNSVSRELLRRYFSNTGLLFPYIHERSFMATFDQASEENFKGVRRSWLALLNIMFAHAVVHPSDLRETSRSDESAVRRTTESEIYFRRASGLCNQQIANGKGTSIEVGELTKIVCCWRYANKTSAISATRRPVSTRYTEISTDMGDPWICCQSRVSTWTSFQ